MADNEKKMSWIRPKRRKYAHTGQQMKVVQSFDIVVNIS